MIKKKILLLLSALSCISAYSQIGIGTNLPDRHSDLTLGSDNKGTMINRVALQSISSSLPLQNANMVAGMMVFNTTKNAELQEGYYFWTNDNKWAKMYVKLAPTSDMHLVTFIETSKDVAGEVRLPAGTRDVAIEIPQLTYTYKAEMDGTLFLDYVLYSFIHGEQNAQAGNVFCHTIVTDENNFVVFYGLTALSPFAILTGQGVNSSYGASNFFFPVETGKTYKIILKAHDSYVLKGNVSVLGTFRFKGIYSSSSLKITFMTEPMM